MLAERVKDPVLDVIQVIEHGFQLLSVVVNGFGSDRSGADTSATTSFSFFFLNSIYMYSMYRTLRSTAFTIYANCQNLFWLFRCTRNYSHDLGHRCVAREKGGCERGDILRQETITAERGGQVCGGGRGPASGCLHFGAPLSSPICRLALDC